jgi:hypothetical protein
MKICAKTRDGSDESCKQAFKNTMNIDIKYL